MATAGTKPKTKKTTTKETPVKKTKVVVDPTKSAKDLEVMNLLSVAHEMRPPSLILSDVKWRYLVHSVIRGNNLMITGPAGSGKTLAVSTVAKAMNRPFYYFNLGATQDPRSSLIGNTHFDKESGTYFNESEFIRAIKTPDAVILLDELSRAHPDAWNILMTVLDDTQRYLRLDEARTTESNIVTVAKGVTFLATANIGMEYTSTRIIDRAMLDRFQLLEMDSLNAAQLEDLIKLKYSSIPDATRSAICSIFGMILMESKVADSKIQSAVSVRTVLAACGLLVDGFSIDEAAEVCIYPFFANDNGDAGSERTYVRQIVQKFIVDPATPSNGDNLFATDV